MSYSTVTSRKTTTMTNRRVVMVKVKRSISDICRDSGDYTKRNGFIRGSRIRTKKKRGGGLLYVVAGYK
jgi:hypothetical protein